MKKISSNSFNLLAAFVAILILLSCCSPEKKNWQILFDGSTLSGWDTYLGAKILPGDSLPSQPIGLNKDTSVFKIVNVDGHNVLRVSGEIWGGISTKSEFENYHLQLQFKWGRLKWFPRADDIRDSGLLYHGVGEHGVGDGFWLRSQEFQIEEGDCGDYWGVAGAGFDIKATFILDSVYQYDPKGSLVTFRQDSEAGRYCKKYPDAEKPSGEWNTIDLYCFEGTSIHVVNGKVVMVLQNSNQSDNGKVTELIKGKIQLQSESAEVYYRDIKIRPIDELPSLE
jgi:hypothetical protein